jgi:glycosyltransferase involved in cell wall biosynthesis
VPRVSVVVATYNWASVLPFSIASVLDQTFTDFELLVIGDGCTDDSAEVVGRINDPRVQWHNLERNHGHQFAPNNEGLKRARGDVVAYLGHDDLWLPRHLELLVAAIDDGAALAHATLLLVPPDKTPAPWPGGRWRYTSGDWIPPTSVVHDRALALRVGGWRAPSETGLREPEADLWQRMVAASGVPQWIRQLTAVKLPASTRRDVYRERPHHEQEVWLDRIRRYADPESALLATYPDRTTSLVSRLRAPLEELRARVAVRTRLRRAGLLAPAPPPETAEELRVARRAFKGLDD